MRTIDPARRRRTDRAFFRLSGLAPGANLAAHPSLNLRWLDGVWYVLRNPPIYIPVAVGAEARFREIVLEDVYQQSYPDFLENYLRRLHEARQADFKPANTSDVFRYAHFMGNLPYLRFTGLTLHWRADQMVGQGFFYFGQRYTEGTRLMVPLAVKLHHACADPLLPERIAGWLQPSLRRARQRKGKLDRHSCHGLRGAGRCARQSVAGEA